MSNAPVWFSGGGGGGDSGESLKGFGDVLNSGLAKQICQGTPGLTVGRKDGGCLHRSNSHLIEFVEA